MRKLIVGLLLTGCSSTGPFEAGPDPAEATATVDLSALPSGSESGPAAKTNGPRSQPEGSYEAIVRVSKEADSKEKRLVFRGVHLDRAGKGSEVASYVADELWRDFDGQRVWVKSEAYQPEGRAIGGEHVRVIELALVDDSTVRRYVGFGAGKTMQGELHKVTGDKGTKSEGETSIVFVDAAGTSHTVLNTTDRGDKKPIETGRVKIVARSVELSKFAAHRGGPAIWITSLEAL